MRASLILLILTSGCGTIVNGRRQEIGVNSVPVGAECKTGDKTFTTPAIVKLKRSRGHTIMCSFGDKRGGASVTRSGSGWVFGNILLGGPVGLLVDWISGGLFKLTPSEVNVAMAESK